MRIQCKYKGFMIHETILSILLLVFMCGIISLKGSVFFDISKNDRALSDTAVLGGLISQYEMEVGKYPDNLNLLTQKNNQYGPWIKSVPNDPWTNVNYGYSYNSNGFIIYSCGKDKQSASSIESGIGGDDIGFIGK